MRATNRGDVPKPYASSGQAKNAADPGEDVVFDSGSLSFVQDWVVDGGDNSAAVDIEPAREDPRQSNPNRRLGVGAQPKKPKPERPEPSALEKKLLRKRQRQELSDAIAGEVDTHGVVSDDKDGDGESKTASFKKKNKKQGGRGEQEATALAPPASAAGKIQSNKDKKDGPQAAAAVAVAVAAPVKGGGGETIPGEEVEDGGGEKQGRKRKARRKKNKSAAPEVVAEEAEAATAGAEATPQASAAVVGGQQSPDAAEVETAGNGEGKKQRRGWGKGRSKPAPVPAEGTDQTSDAAEGEGGWKADERRPRKKTRSRQKNIRKDKRPLEKRPSYLRVGDPEFSGRGLTEETRKFLGLPADDFGDAPPAGWGKPGKMAAKPVFLIDKKPRRLPKHLAPEGVGGDGVQTVEAGVDAGQGAASPSAGNKRSPASKSKSKYKNLTLPTGAAMSIAKQHKDKKAKQSLSSSGPGSNTTGDLEGGAAMPMV